jgi:hypothetical protein
LVVSGRPDPVVATSDLHIYRTQDDADAAALYFKKQRVACVCIEWEE